MKNGFKFWSLAIIVALVAGFASCKKEKEKEKEPSIEGRWQLDKNAMSASDLANYENCHFEGWFDLASDGSFTQKLACEDDVVTGAWKRDRNNLTMTAKNGASDTFTIESLSETQLVTSKSQGISGKKIIETYKRIR